MSMSTPSASRSLVVRRAIDQMNMAQLMAEVSVDPRVWLGVGPNGNTMRAFASKAAADAWSAELTASGFAGHSIRAMELEA